MYKTILTPPFNTSELKYIASRLREKDWIDASNTIGWLLKHNLVKSMIYALKEAWLTSSLPLRDWAYRIENVEVCVGYHDLKLAVHLIGEQQYTIMQAAPFSQARLKRYLNPFPKPIPDLMRALALSAPDLTLDEIGAFAKPSYFSDRLGYVTWWLADESRKNVEERGFIYPDKKIHLMEVAENGIGDCYVFGMDGSIDFFDHEADGLVRCEITLDDLFEAYLESPEDFMDPYAMNWAKAPEDNSAGDSVFDMPHMILSRKMKLLPCLAGIALSVRGCQRAMPINYLRSIPPEWEEYDKAITHILKKCKNVATTGVHLDIKYVKIINKISNDVSSYCSLLSDSLGTGYLTVMFTSRALPALGNMCHDIHSEKAVEESLAYCGAVMTIRGGKQHEAAIKAAITDADYLLSLNLGHPGTIGKPVPPEVFDRPLWPNGKYI